MYVDDGKLYVSSNSLPVETNVTLLKLAYKEVETWLFQCVLPYPLFLNHRTRLKEPLVTT